MMNEPLTSEQSLRLSCAQVVASTGQELNVEQVAYKAHLLMQWVLTGKPIVMPTPANKHITDHASNV